MEATSFDKMSRDGAAWVVETGLYPFTDLSGEPALLMLGLDGKGRRKGAWTASSALQNGMQEKCAAAWAVIGTPGTWIWGWCLGSQVLGWHLEKAGAGQEGTR